jgi:predicted RNase H-like HicB family nuclease
MKLVYPAIFTPDEDGCIGVEVPDLPGCVSFGTDMADAILMGVDAASGWILGEWENGDSAPEPSALEDIDPEDGGIVSLIALDMDAYAEKYGKTAVRKNLTIPAYLNTAAEAAGVNFSKVLQDALKQRLFPAV